MSRALVLFSGGKDSTVALKWTQGQFDEVIALAFHPPFRPRGEVAAADRIADLLSVRLRTVPLGFLMDVATAREESSPRQTAGAFVPVRNLIFHSIGYHLAACWRCESIVAGHVQSDVKAYADASEDYLRDVNGLAHRGRAKDYSPDWNHISLELPLSSLSDTQVARLGRRLQAPLELSWSCLEDGEHPCGSCVSCRDREAALAGERRTVGRSGRGSHERGAQ